MPCYVRLVRPGGTVFLTLVTERRRAIFADAGARALLREAIEHCRVFHPFDLEAIVCLPDHLHLLLRLPENDADYPLRITHIKAGFTRAYLAAGGAEAASTRSRQRQRMRGVWQKRFWEHTISSEDDLIHHHDYIHYNPVKHGYAVCPHAWEFSSFHRLVREGHYEANWCCACEGAARAPRGIEGIALAAGE